ncbi:putative homoserine dehydrogenase [Rubrobacter radiotolerans]|uniref:Putative homoserine dehydrogenase n=1 Tax=Rubrobacter radiotolerans TaxID=42256 RepID=A0A023X5K8_RUBRA|nr:3-hydroxyacyl-CoA dehydrogenase NAD-binding domain-containing protein [Rubrobacter radiotolerans]AHY47757.1 putative homoserine dehydrogenase [Rubrobacter radiotolerans]
MLHAKLRELERAGTPIRVGLVGAGQMGRGFIAQVANIPGMRVAGAADIDPKRAAEAFKRAGQEPTYSLAKGSAKSSANGSADASPAVTDDAGELARWEGVDVIVEATGVPEVGARVAVEAIEAQKHLVMLNVETDITVGVVLKQMADRAGVVYTGSAGDEPGAILELCDFANSLGFEVVAAGKGKNNPLNTQATPDTLKDEARKKAMNPKMLTSFVDGTKTMVELCATANALGFVPDTPGGHGPEESDANLLTELFCLKEEGGILSSYGTVDYVRGVAPGVFIIIRSAEGDVRETMAYLGQGEGPNHVLYRPYHLTSLETPISVARAAIYGQATITSLPEPSAEVTAVAKRDLKVGERLGPIGGFDYYGFVRSKESARGLLPVGLASGACVVREVRKGQEIERRAVELAEGSFVAELRERQDAALAAAHG